MNRQRFHQQLLDTIESELACAGCIVSAVQRQRIARLFRLIERVRTYDDSNVLCVELGYELHNLEKRDLEKRFSYNGRLENGSQDRELHWQHEEESNFIPPPELWLDQSECA